MERIKIKNICEVNPKQEILDDNFIISFVGMAQISNDNQFDTSILKKYEDVKKGFSSFKDGDILFAKITPCMENGKGVLIENLYNGIGFGSTEFHVLRPNIKVVDKKYLYWFTMYKKFRLNCEKNMTGSAGQKRVPKNYIENYEIKLPKLIIQEKRVKILDTILKIKQEKLEQIKKLEELSKSIFIKMFYETENIFPESTIGKTCKLKSGNSLNIKIENEGGNVPYIKVGDMNCKGNEKYITTSTHYVTEKTANKGIFETGTIIFPKRGGAIGTNKKRLTIKPICVDLNVMGVMPNKKILHSEYVYMYFLLLDMNLLNNGSSVPQINNKDIEPLIIKIPPIELQNQFAERIKIIEKSKVEIQKSIEETQKLFDSLMEKYFG